jgi:hypothetical protein
MKKSIPSAWARLAPTKMGVDAASEFATQILGNHAHMDLAQAERDVVAAAMALKACAPDIHAVVLECTNMPPYQAAIEAATGFKTLWLKEIPRLFAWATSSSA